MDASEFDEFYTASFARISGHLHALIGDREEARDCVQEAFVRAWSHRRTLRGGPGAEAWVRTTAYRLAVSRWRRARLGRRAPDRALSPPTQAPSPDGDRLDLMAALARLPEPTRRAVVLHHLVGLSVAEIAAECRAPEGTIKARLSRGRAALAGHLADSAEGVPHA